MRLIGLAEVALELACRRGLDRTAFGKPLVNLGGNRERIADARIAIDQARLLVLNAAWKLDDGRPAERALRGQPDQGGGAEHGPAGHRHGDPAARRRRAVRRLPARRRRGPTPGRCGWPTGPTRCTAAWSPGSSSGKYLSADERVSRVLVTGARVRARRRAGAGVRRARRRGARAPTVGDRRPRRRRARAARSTSRSDDDWAAAPRLGRGALGRPRRPGQQRRRRRRRPDRRRRPWTSGSGSPRSTCSAWSAAPARSCRCSRRSAPATIVNVASLAGLVHPAGMASYNAVKAGGGGVHARPPATSSRSTACTARWSARRTSGPT